MQPCFHLTAFQPTPNDRPQPSPTAAPQVVQEIKLLRSTVLSRDKERAERATLVVQEKLVRSWAGGFDFEGGEGGVVFKFGVGGLITRPPVLDPDPSLNAVCSNPKLS
jgi:hypothetical protein